MVWERVTLGRSGADVARGDGVYRKQTSEAELEAATLSWLRAQGLPAAEVLDAGPGWLLTREIVGRTGADPWPECQRLAVVDALADVTRTLHRLPPAGCPFDRTLAVTVSEARAAAAAGQVDLDDLDQERRGRGVQDLLDALAERLPEVAAEEDPVVTHGDWCLPNVLLDPETVQVVGIVDTARAGVADRYADLALMTRSFSSEDLNPQYGDWYAERFLERCGVWRTYDE